MDLLLQSVNQDQWPKNGSVDAFFGWRHGPAAGGDGDKLPRFSLRKENWGGVFIYGPTQSVYLVDTEAYVLLERIKCGETLAQIKKNPGGISPTDIDEFERLLKKHGVKDC